MSVEDVEIITKRDKRSKTHHGSPRDPKMISKIIEWRDEKGMTLQAIGDKLGMTRAGVRHLYMRWYSWANKEEE